MIALDFPLDLYGSCSLLIPYSITFVILPSNCMNLSAAETGRAAMEENLGLKLPFCESQSIWTVLQ